MTSGRVVWVNDSTAKEFWGEPEYARNMPQESGAGSAINRGIMGRWMMNGGTHPFIWFPQDGGVVRVCVCVCARAPVSPSLSPVLINTVT